MQNEARFDQCGWLVRVIYGRLIAPYRIPGTVSARIWRFKSGFCVRNQSLTEALELANRIRRRSEHENNQIV